MKSVSSLPDGICEQYSKKKIELNIEIDEDNVIIEGNKETLEFVGNLILSQTNYDDDCSFFIGPNGPGNIFFNKKSSHGIYIHRLPCKHKKTA